MNTVTLKKVGVVMFWLIIMLTLIVLITALTIYFYPKTIASLQQAHFSTLSYKQSIAAIEDDIKNDKRNTDIRPNCRPIVKTHGKKATKSVVMLHGLSACPEQFSELANTFFKAGYNVYVPRTPQHGFVDNKQHDAIQLSEIADFLNGTASKASGLGGEVGVVGLSGGATLATWLIQHTDIFSRALLLSPFYEPSVARVPKWQLPFMMTLYGRNILPSSFSGDLSVRAVAKYTLVRNNYRPDLAASSLKHLAVITSERDGDIDLSLAHTLPRDISKANNSTYQETRIAKSFGVGHDIVHPNAPSMKQHKAQLYTLYLQMYNNQKAK